MFFEIAYTVIKMSRGFQHTVFPDMLLKEQHCLDECMNDFDLIFLGKEAKESLEY